MDISKANNKIKIFYKMSNTDAPHLMSEEDCDIQNLDEYDEVTVVRGPRETVSSGPHYT